MPEADRSTKPARGLKTICIPCSQEQYQRIVDDPHHTSAHVIGMAELLSDLPVRPLSPIEAADVAKGRPVLDADVGASGRLASSFVRLLDADGALAAVAEPRGGSLHPLVVLL